ncbi:winged helix-turn-helix domain-containing protein [Olsenella uli]|uniref:MarR family transcriptional regulator n=1 Tax=Olsenella uli TaxID=133926 RepID=UPI00195EAA36|nr:helix-turn-helix domain-containing protein [Olsenella uli]MBM6676276.1 winged helix-turn-helix domain-containing protein [Olsenella uli]
MVDGSAMFEESDIRTLRTPPSSRIRNTPNGPIRLTPSELQIIKFLERHEGHPCSKAQIAAAIGRNEKTVNRLLSRMRRDQLVISQAVHSENGAQLANVYRLTKWATEEM